MNFTKEHIKSGGDLSYYDLPSKLIIRTTADRIVASIDYDQNLVLNSVNVGKLRNTDWSLEYILGIINSKLIEFWYRLSVQETAKTFAEVKIVYMERIPICEINRDKQSALSSLVRKVLEAVVKRVPAPTGDDKAPLQALIFDSVFNSFRGIIAYFKIENGVISKGDKVKFFNTGMEYDADEIGVLKMDMIPRQELGTGEVGYIISGIKNATEVKVGDTITHIARPCEKAIAGFQEVKPMVFAGVYPIDPSDYENLRASLEKLQLNDASLTFSPESSVALGFGFRCGFLGLLHMEIVQERLDREFNMDVITTVPNVSYMVYDKQGGEKEVHNPSGLPDPTMIDHIEEPYIRATIITAADYIGPIMKLCLDKRGELINQEYVSGNRVELHFMLPLGEIVIDFYDKLKSISKGYASFDYHIDSFRHSDLVKLDILLNGEPVDALSTLTHRDNAVSFGRRMCEKLKDLIPRQQFDIAIQAAIGAKIVARETVKQVRKDVTAKCYGGDVSRKRKLLEKQKKGKKRMKQIGNVEVPQKAFLAVLKLD